MEPSDKLGLIAKKYRRVLELAATQLRLLEEGRIEELPPILQQKSDEVEEAGLIMAELKDAADPASRKAIQEGIAGLAELVSEVMKLEDKCQGFYSAIPAKPAMPRARAASIYQKNIK